MKVKAVKVNRAHYFLTDPRIIHIAFILIYAPWPTKKTTVAHYWAMAHRLKTPGLNQSFSCFFQLVLFISSSVGPVYVFHPLHVPLPLSKHLPQVVSKHDHTTSHHSLLPAYLLLPSIPTCHHLLCISLVHQLYTTHLPYHRSFCSSQNSYFIFSQTPRFASI